MKPKPFKTKAEAYVAGFNAGVNWEKGKYPRHLREYPTGQRMASCMTGTFEFVDGDLISVRTGKKIKL